MRYLRVICRVFSAGLLVLPLISQAASFRAMELPDLVQHSSSVWHCRVVDKETSYKTTPSGERIFTRYLLALEEDWLPGAQLKSRQRSLWVQGGRIGQTAQYVHGYPQLQVGQRYVLFVENAQSSLPITGGAQGVYRVLESKSDAQRVAPLSAPGQAISLPLLKAQVQAVAP